MAVLDTLKLGGRHRKGPSAVWPPCPCMSATYPVCSVSRGRKRGSSQTLHSLPSPLFLGLFLSRPLVPDAMAESGWSSLLPLPLLCPSSSKTNCPSPPPSCRCCWLTSASFVVLGHYLTGIRPTSSVPFSVFRRCEEEGPSSEAETLCCVHFAKVLETKDLHIGAYMNCGKFCVHSA
jgi:hypothetical protein